MKKIIILLLLSVILKSAAFAGFGDGYTAPCSKAPNGYKYCNAIGKQTTRELNMFFS